VDRLCEETERQEKQLQSLKATAAPLISQSKIPWEVYAIFTLTMMTVGLAMLIVIDVESRPDAQGRESGARKEEEEGNEGQGTHHGKAEMSFGSVFMLRVIFVAFIL
jgi:hypothetical protein